MYNGMCDTFWGSHGCSLPPGHSGPHLCLGSFVDDAWTKWDPEAFCSTPAPGQEIYSLARGHEHTWTIEDESETR